MRKGVFITFEGADGCGKTTQINLLDEYLISKKIPSLLTREPGARGLGTKLREILLNYEGEIASTAESFLFLADRAQHIEKIIKPAIEEKKIILCDRHTDSTLAYQGYGRGLDIDRIKYLNDIATGGLKPDLTIVFDIDAETSSKRVGANKDRMESAGMDFFNRVRQGYLKIAEEEPGRVKVINACDTIENVHKQVMQLIEAL